MTSLRLQAREENTNYIPTRIVATAMQGWSILIKKEIVSSNADHYEK